AIDIGPTYGFQLLAPLCGLVRPILPVFEPNLIADRDAMGHAHHIGASYLKPLFIAGCSVTAASFFLSLVIERYLRHSGREQVLASLAVLGSAIGGLGLILLSVFDTKHFPSVHRSFLIVFIVGVALSAIFTIAEYRYISQDFEGLQELKIAYIVKGVITLILIALSIAFAVTLFRATDVGAVLEWVIAFGFTFFLLTFVSDLRQSKNRERGELRRYRESTGTTPTVDSTAGMTEIR
ncbi:hypothetical protein CVT24_007800, partial [Panaeolus cyanescens]